MGKIKKVNKKAYLTAKLTIFDWGWRDNVVYACKARDQDKQKGLMMLDKLRNFFGVSKQDEEEFRKKMIDMQIKAFTPTEHFGDSTKIDWTRNKKGKIVSPFRSNKNEQE